ncbi:coenzyme F420-0:L-glutamate ligase [Eubacteriales bacterium OttesenSCG-928-G02]|nr:coenzyme F420-0:L-glutamate ligase [Eubacteriales bacterium OttesenSCG-928-G02]
MKYTGVTARGIITPIFKVGDDLVSNVVDSVINASNNENFNLNDGDIIGITEAVLARTQGNYATCEQISSDIKDKFNSEELGIVFPILSRNRFSILLKAIAMSTNKLYIQLSYPADEVGNLLVARDIFDKSGVNPYTDSFTEDEFREIFPPETTIHRFTGVDYIEFYKTFNPNIEIVFSNDPTHILKYTKNVLTCDIHSRSRSKKLINDAGAYKCFGLDDILTNPINGSGYNEIYGLLGSNKATENMVKLFPRNSQTFVEDVAALIKNKTNKNIEVLVYGDGGFKDPVGGIWELADPVVSPGFTKGLIGTPNEIKMKYLADTELSDFSGEELIKRMKAKILEKDSNLYGSMASQGTTPRQLTDLLGSLCDLISGSGDKGTPVVLIQNYFKNYAVE